MKFIRFFFRKLPQECSPFRCNIWEKGSNILKKMRKSKYRRNFRENSRTNYKTNSRIKHQQENFSTNLSTFSEEIAWKFQKKLCFFFRIGYFFGNYLKSFFRNSLNNLFGIFLNFSSFFYELLRKFLKNNFSGNFLRISLTSLRNYCWKNHRSSSLQNFQLISHESFHIPNF